MRRLVAAGIGLLVVVLLVLGINGCLDSRREQALKDYNRDVASLVQDADANADTFFDTLAGGGDSSTERQSDVNQLRVRAQSLTKQAETIGVPGEMKHAQRNLLLSLSLVQEAMGRVAEKLPSALGSDTTSAEPAVNAIAGEMEAFMAGDVLYNRRTKTLVKEVLDRREIGGQTIQSSSFLQNLGWLQPSTVARRIGAQAGRGAGDGASTDPAPGLHGHGVIGVSVGDVALQPGQSNRIAAGSNVTFNVKIANQGDNPESDVRVRVRVTGGGDPITAQRTIDQTMAKTETTVSVALGRQPPIGAGVEITIEVLAVPGEKNTTNNELTFPAIFTRG